MAIYNRQYAVHVHTDKSLLELQVGIDHRSWSAQRFFGLTNQDSMRVLMTKLTSDKFFFMVCGDTQFI